MARLNLGDHPSLQERVYRELREAIISGALRPGERLVETSLAGRLGVSRSPVREAIRRLEQDGLVTFSPRRGVAVGTATTADVDDLYSVRAVLEALAARLAARRRNPRHLEAMLRVVGRMERALAALDTAAVVRAAADFHRVLVEASGNVKLEEIMSGLLDAIRRVRLTVHSDPAWSAAALEVHRAILAAVERHDEARAVELMGSHIEDARRQMESLMAGPGAAANGAVGAALANDAPRAASTNGLAPRGGGGR